MTPQIFELFLCLLGGGGSVTNLSGIECTAKISAPALVTFRRAGIFFLYFHITPVFSYFIIINLKYIRLFLCTGLYKKNVLGAQYSIKWPTEKVMGPGNFYRSAVLEIIL